MHIGCPKEIKPQEFRVGMTPNAVREAVAHGHTVSVETNAGTGAGFADADYTAAGAQIIATAEEVFAKEEINNRHFWRSVLQIIEAKDADAETLRLRTVNTGVLCASAFRYAKPPTSSLFPALANDSFTVMTSAGRASPTSREICDQISR